MGLGRIILCAIVAIGPIVFARPAPAVLLDANITGVFTDLTFATPTGAVLLGGDAFLDVNVGNGVTVSVDISNPSADSIQAIFAALDVDPTQLSLLGGVFSGSILSASCGAFCTTDLGSSGGPVYKSDDPSGFEILAAAFHSSASTVGIGPDVGAALLFFQVLNTDTPIPIGLGIASGNGILINGVTVDEFNQSSHSALVQFDPSIIYGPEPSQSALLSTGLIGLTFLSRTRMSRSRRTSRRTSQRRSQEPTNASFASHSKATFTKSLFQAGLIVSFLLVAMPAAAQMDTDSDGVFDVSDNCIDVPNASQEDADQDGFGTVCDGDFNQDGYVLGLDIIFWYQNCFNLSLFPACDVNGPGSGGSAGALATLLGPLWNLEIGPSGWSCATIPPVDTSMGDPPCLVP